MKILCSKSSVEFDCSHFPGTFYARELCHPVFYLDQKRLLSYARKWAGQELTPTDSYLLFLAILNSSEHVEFRSPAHRDKFTDSIVANNMEPLLRTVIKLNSVVNPAVVFPRFAVSNETRNLQNVHHWIKVWQEAYENFQAGNPSAHESRALINREAALARMIRSPHKSAANYATQIADWAALAGNFPNHDTPNVFKGGNEKMRLSDYWRIIIIRCAKEEGMFALPLADIKELLEHCEENIPIGTLHAHALFEVLRKAIKRHTNFLGLGDPDLQTNFTLLVPGTNMTVEQANLQSMIAAAPEKEPQPADYPKHFDYLRAKMQWTAAQNQKRLEAKK